MNPLAPERVDELVEVIELDSGARVLDLGCGKGELLLRLVTGYGAAGVGVDLRPELLWRNEPSGEYLAALGASRDELPDYAGMIRAGEDAGLMPLYAVASNATDFDRYEWSWSMNGERYAAEHPDEPGVDEFLAWIITPAVATAE